MMKFIKSRLNKKGFTLVELLIVIAVLGIIAGIGVNSMTGVTNTFKVNADKETAKMLARTVEINILAGEVDMTSDATALAGAITIVETDRPTPQSGGNFVVSAFSKANEEITITFGTKTPLDSVKIDIAIKAVN